MLRGFGSKADPPSLFTSLHLAGCEPCSSQQGIKSGRAVFAKARKFPHATWQVFEASGK